MLRLISCFSLLLAATTAMAQSIDDAAGQGAGSLDAERLRPGLSREAILDVEAATVPAHLDVDLGLQLGYANDPIVAFVDSGDSGDGVTRRSIVEHRVGADLMGSVAFGGLVQLGVDVPLVLLQSGAAAVPGLKGANPVAAAGLGDVRLVPKLALWRSVDGAPVDVAVAAHVTLPTAVPRHGYIGDGLPTLTPELIVSRDHGALRWAANAGFKLRAPSTFGSAIQGDEVTARAAVGYDFASFGVDASANASVLVFPAVFSPGNNPVEGLVGVHEDIGDVQLFAAVGSGVGGVGAPLLRTFAGVRWSGRCDDSDGDGLCKDVDLCEGIAEDVDGHDDGDGCRDADNDGDGVLDDLDACRDVAGDGPDGCAAVIEVPAPLVVVEPAVEPAVEPVVIVAPAAEVRLSLAGAVAFATGSSTLRAEALLALHKLVDDARAGGKPFNVRVEGHTDNRGDAKQNQALSQSRAEAVKAALVKMGIEADRIEAVGRGATQPIANNDDDAGRAQNRRVELVVSG